MLPFAHAVKMLPAGHYNTAKNTEHQAAICVGRHPVSSRRFALRKLDVSEIHGGKYARFGSQHNEPHGFGRHNRSLGCSRRSCVGGANVITDWDEKVLVVVTPMASLGGTVP
jgi:hypothetical protein